MIFCRNTIVYHDLMKETVVLHVLFSITPDTTNQCFLNRLCLLKSIMSSLMKWLIQEGYFIKIKQKNLFLLLDKYIQDVLRERFVHVHPLVTKFHLFSKPTGTP